MTSAGLKGLSQNQKHLVATTSVTGGGGGVVAGSQGTPIQLVGLQMNPGSRNLTATVSAAAAVSNQPQTTGPKMPVQRLSCPQLMRPGSGTTLKLTQTGGVAVGGGAATGGIFG